MAEAVVEFDYKAQEPDELNLRKGDVITDIKTQPGGWWEGTLARTGKRGMFPDNFVKVVEASSTHTSDVTLRSTPGRRCKVLFSYQPANEDELEIQVNDIIDILSEVEEGWWKGKLRNKIGVFPSNFVTELLDESSSEPKDGTHRKSSRSSLDDNFKAVNSMNHEEDVLPASSSGDSDVPTLPPKPVKEMCKVLYAYDALNEDELTIREGDLITLLSRDGQDKGWWKGELRGKVGLFPDNFIQIIPCDESTKPARPPLKGNTTNRIRDSITKPPTSTQQQPAEKSLQRRSLELPPKPEDKVSPPGVSKKPVLPPPPLKKPQRSPSSSLSKSLATSPSNITADSKSQNITNSPTKPPDSPTTVAGARLPLTTLTASIKQLTVIESTSSSTSTTSHLTEQTTVLSKPTGPKHSDSTDLMDGLCFSRNSGAYSISNHSVITSETEPAVNSLDMDFDSVGRTAMLTHPTASRVRAPRRRPPSTVNVTVDMRKPQEVMGLFNGSAEPHIHNDSDKTNKVPWVEELKLNQAKKNSAIAQGRSRVSIGGTSEPSPPVSQDLASSASKTSPNILNVNVTLRNHPSSGPRPQSLYSGDRSTSSTARAFGLISTSPSDSVTVSAKQWADLNDKVTRLEATLETQCEKFLKAIKELTNKLNEETERRLQMQLEIEKLTDLVTQV